MHPVYIKFCAMLGAALANMVLGAGWYSPLLFGKAWMKAAGYTQDHRPDADQARQGYVASAVSSLVCAFALSIIFQAFSNPRWADVSALGLTLGLGIFATLSLPHYLFAGKPIRLYLINVGYAVTSLLIMSLIIGLWR
jgi:uncharacterized membrane protein YccC